MTVGISVIGVGIWGKNHARVIRELNNARLVSVCDINKDRAKYVGELYGCKWCTDYREVLKDPEVDAVTICTPSATHASIALEVIKYGKHLLVEKPMATTSEDARKIVEAAEREDLVLMVGFIERFNPGVSLVKELVEGSKIGTPLLVTARRVSWWPERVGDVGVVKDLAIHEIDIARFILGEPYRVYARVGSLKHKYEDYAEIMLSFPRTTVFIETNWLTPYKVRKLIVTGSEGIITLDYITQSVSLADSEKITNFLRPWKEPLKIELEHFADCVSKNKTPLASGIDGLRALEIAEAALKSGREGIPVDLSFE